MEPYSNHERPPETRNLSDPAAYREHVAETMKRAYTLGQRNRRLGDRYALAAILLAFASSAVGFLTAATNVPAVGIVAGVMAAGAGAVGSWVRRSRYDTVAAAYEHLERAVQRELRHFDARIGVYEPLPDEPADAGEKRAFKAFVERCEQLSDDAAAWADKAAAEAQT